jgi:hypothetical protein
MLLLNKDAAQVRPSLMALDDTFIDIARSFSFSYVRRLHRTEIGAVPGTSISEWCLQIERFFVSGCNYGPGCINSILASLQRLSRRSTVERNKDVFNFVFIVLDRSHHYIQLLFVLSHPSCPAYPLATGSLFVIDCAIKPPPIYCCYWSRRPKKSPLILPMANNSV